MSRFWIKLNGLSMSPLLRERDNILIAPIILEDLKCGDILLFLDQSSKELTLHRLIAFPMKTKGDLSLYAEMNPADSCLGKAIGFKRGDFYRILSPSDAFLSRLYLHLSKLRMRGGGFRK